MNEKELRGAIRRQKIQARNSLTAEGREKKSQEILERLVASPEFSEAGTILIYRATKGEVNIDKVSDIGKTLCKRMAFPLVISKEEMIALVPEDETAWTDGYFGIKEPIRERSEEIPPKELDLIVCPCTSFDESGGRMGMGAGFYDRYIQRAVNAKVVAVAFECQKADSVIMQAWDQPMDAVFTEKTVYRPSLEDK